jgi:hypothetical protein
LFSAHCDAFFQVLSQLLEFGLGFSIQASLFIERFISENFFFYLTGIAFDETEFADFFTFFFVLFELSLPLLFTVGISRVNTLPILSHFSSLDIINNKSPNTKNKHTQLCIPRWGTVKRTLIEETGKEFSFMIGQIPGNSGD